MATSLGIIESPTKAITHSKYLERNDQVLVSADPLMNFPESKLGIDLERNFDSSVDRTVWAANWLPDCHMRRLKKYIEHPASLACTVYRPYDKYAKKPVTLRQVD